MRGEPLSLCGLAAALWAVDRDEDPALGGGQRA
jgi:hypothetical protein